MTNKEVINFLNQVRKILLDDKSWLESTIQPINEAFDMAIDALTAQSEAHADLIDRQALMKEFADFVRRSNNSDFAPTPTWNDAVSLVGSMPPVQPSSSCAHENDSISRQAAIDAMTNTLWHYPNECYRNLNKYEFAKGLAELGLKSVPPAQPPARCIAEIKIDKDELEELVAKSMTNIVQPEIIYCRDICRIDASGYHLESGWDWDEDVLKWAPMPLAWWEETE